MSCDAACWHKTTSFQVEFGDYKTIMRKGIPSVCLWKQYLTYKVPWDWRRYTHTPIDRPRKPPHPTWLCKDAEYLIYWSQQTAFEPLPPKRSFIWLSSCSDLHAEYVHDHLKKWGCTPFAVRIMITETDHLPGLLCPAFISTQTSTLFTLLHLRSSALNLKSKQHAAI